MSRLLLPLLLLPAAPILAHETGPENFRELGSEWGTEPVTVILLLLTALIYLRGVFRLYRASPRSVKGRDMTCFVAGWLALVIALVSPLHPWGSVLFSAHMTQHELLMLVAAPLLVLGRPIVAFLWALPKSAAVRLSKAAKTWQRFWKILTLPFVAWLIHAVVLWSWHVPALFQATLTSEFVHALQHLSFLASALLFWWAILHARARALSYGVAVLYMFTTALHSGLLGALLTFAGTLWYPAYAGTTQSWGLTPLEDQQLGGLIMWIPAGVVYILAGLALFAGWLRESDRRTQPTDLATAPAR
jgi:putative membrane protein